jgi:hypothetical protein
LLLNPPNTKHVDKYLNPKGMKLQASHLVPVDSNYQPISIATLLAAQAEEEEEEEEDEEEDEEAGGGAPAKGVGVSEANEEEYAKGKGWYPLLGAEVGLAWGRAWDWNGLLEGMDNFNTLALTDAAKLSFVGVRAGGAPPTKAGAAT